MIDYIVYLLLIISIIAIYSIGICICFDYLNRESDYNKVKAARLSIIWPVLFIYWFLSNIFKIIYDFVKLLLGKTN